MSIFGSSNSTPQITPPPVPVTAASNPTPPSFGKSLINKPSSGMSGGFGSTILTSGMGDLTPTNTAKKSLLGQ